MPDNEAYFNSEEFQELLHTYETSMKAGEQPFMDVDDLVDIADYYNQDGRSDDAMEVIDYALQLYPDATLPNVFMARDALMQTDFETAKEYLNRIGEKDDPDYHYLVAEIMIAEDKIEEADRYLRDYGMTVAPDEYQDFIKDCANLYIDYGHSTKAYEWMLRIKGDNSKDFKELMARILFSINKYDEAAELFTELIDQEPYSLKYWNALTSIQLMAEDYASAVTSSEYAIAIDPKNPEALYNKANALVPLQNHEEAMKYYQKYIEVAPYDEGGHLQLGICLIHLGKREEALSTLTKAASIAPENSPYLPQIYQELAFCYSAMKQPEKALEMIEKTKDYTNEDSNFLLIKGHILLANEQPEQASKIWEKALEKSNNSSAIILRIIVSLYDNHYTQPAYNMMKKFFEDCSDDKDFPSESYAYMALCCHDLGYKEEFLKYLNMAIQKNPSETKIILGFLFPPETDIDDYYNYMTHQLSK